MGTTIMDSYTPSRSRIHARQKTPFSEGKTYLAQWIPLLKSTKRLPCACLAQYLKACKCF